MKKLRKIAFVGDYPPRQCGIATFTHDLSRAMTTQFPEVSCPIISLTDHGGPYKYPKEVIFEIREKKLNDYRQAADFIRIQDADAICVQHEFGIYGGSEGSHLLTLLRKAKLPIVTTLHTILTNPTPNQRRVFNELTALSQRLVAMSNKGREILRDTYGISEKKIAVIPHGIPETPFTDPSFYKDQFGVERKKVLLTFGLLAPGKGLEYAIKALPGIIEKHPDVVYIILGATHPNLIRREGEAYRFKLQQLARELKVDKHVLFFNRFVELDELIEFIGASDIYLTPYLNEAQITSGTLAYTYGCGKAVISTPYWHAKELLSNDRGILVPFANSEEIKKAVNNLFDDEIRLNTMRKKAYIEGRQMVWSRVTQSYMKLFYEARLDAGPQQPLTLQQRAGNVKSTYLQMDIPEIKLDHLKRLTDNTGIFQHAIFSFPNFNHGYCIDDNARALIFTSMYEDLQTEAEDSVKDLARTYAAFINYSFNADNGRFRNFMKFDHQWLEDAGSDDSHARTLWALGTCVARSTDQGLQNWAAKLLEKALPPILESPHLRSWAFTLIGLHEYQRRLVGAINISEAHFKLAQKLHKSYLQNASDDWPWFEKKLSYANAKLSHALIVSGRSLNNKKMLNDGLDTLRWLCQQQCDENGYFSPIGSEGFYPKEGEKARFDQQPIEAHATISGCLEAFLVTQNRFWLDEALRAYRWFLGANKLSLPLYDAHTGGCRDGLHVDRLNENQGAESTLAFLLSTIEIKSQEHTLSAFNIPVELDKRNNYQALEDKSSTPLQT